METDVGKKKCHFPFKRNGKWYHDCVEDTPRWCSLTEDYDTDKQKANCVCEYCNAFDWTKTQGNRALGIFLFV